MVEAGRPLDMRKVAQVGEVLKGGFPGLEVLDAYDFNRSAQFYRIGRGTDLFHRVYVSTEFFSDHSLEELSELLRRWKAVETIRAAGTRAVIIASMGIIVPGTKLDHHEEREER